MSDVEIHTEKKKPELLLIGNKTDLNESRMYLYLTSFEGFLMKLEVNTLYLKQWNSLRLVLRHLIK